MHHHSITVYCASSSKVDEVYFAAAREAGTAIGQRGLTLVYGGSYVGLMRAVADSARSAGGKVVGITPQLMVDQDVHDRLCDELIVTPDMRERKRLLEERGDAFLVLPGGIGTLEELFEVLVGRALGYHGKPIALVNTNGCYDALLALLADGEKRHLVKSSIARLLLVHATAEEAVAALMATPNKMLNPADTVFEFEKK
jgi:uncharacterized protein (TIGR00730 family)